MIISKEYIEKSQIFFGQQTLVTCLSKQIIKTNNFIPTYYRVPLDYGTKPKYRNNKNKVKGMLTLDETNMTSI